MEVPIRGAMVVSLREIDQRQIVPLEVPIRGKIVVSLRETHQRRIVPLEFCWSMQWARVPLGMMQMKLLSQADSVNLKSRLCLVPIN